MIITFVSGFQLNMCNNNDLHLRKNKISKSFERQIYARYLIDKRKSEKMFKKKISYFNETNYDIDNTYQETRDDIFEYNNENANIKKIIIGNNINIDVKNIKNIMISTNNDTITIELDKSYKKPLNNDIILLSKNIKELDTLLNLLDIFLNILK
tara:strand:+ start:1555 stop:2016 length:462 start_codon:yes stop_codon:yes gene_type:complete